MVQQYILKFKSMKKLYRLDKKEEVGFNVLNKILHPRRLKID